MRRRSAIKSRFRPMIGSISRMSARPPRGQTMVLMAGAMVVLLGMGGVIYDVGHAWAVKQRMQAAADAAAKAGANEIANQSKSSVQNAALYDATQNGFTSGVTANGVTVNSVTINNPPKNGIYSNPAQNTYVEAIINASVSTTFLRVLDLIPGVSFHTFRLTSRAVAKPNPAPICIQSLDLSAQHAMVIGDGVSAGITVNAPSCDVYSDSSNGDPIGTHPHPGPCLKALQIFVDNGMADDGDCVTPYPPPTDSPPVADLLAAIPAPSKGGLSVASATKKIITASTTLNPGIYTGGIWTCSTAACPPPAGSPKGTLSAPSNPANPITITFNPGMYYIDGGGIQIGPPFVSSAKGGGGSGGGTTAGACGKWDPPGMSEPLPNTGTTANVTLTGSGVTFYNTGAAFAPISIFATSTSSLSAPTDNSGSGMEAMLFFQDRSVGACTVNLIYGGTYTGTFYFEPSVLGFGGSGGAYNYFIADKIQLTTNLTVNTDYTSLADGGLIKLGSALAE